MKNIDKYIGRWYTPRTEEPLSRLSVFITGTLTDERRPACRLRRGVKCELERMAYTRDRVLSTLLSQKRCTINELAYSVGINPISVRHHIAKLEAEGLVTSDEELHGVGRPRRVYFLTEAGLEQFPTRYMRLTVRLLEQLKESLPEHAVKGLFAQMAQVMVNDYTAEAHTDGLTMEERLKLMKELLSKEGFNVEWEQRGEQYHIRETNCPYLHVSQNHPEVCSVDQTLISALLDVPAHKIKCVLNGDAHCTYVVSQPDAQT